MSLEKSGEELLSTREAADYLDITVSGLKYHLKVGNLEPAKRFGRAMAFRREDLDRIRENSEAWKNRGKDNN